MNRQHPDGEERGRTDDEQLLTLLRELIQTEGLPETAELLGVSARTLQRTTASGRLTVRMRDALELRRLSEESATTNPRDEEADGLAQRVEHLEDRVEALADELRATRDKRRPPRHRRTHHRGDAFRGGAGNKPAVEALSPAHHPGSGIRRGARLRRGDADHSGVAAGAGSTARPGAGWTDWMPRDACGSWRSCSSGTTS